MTTERMGVFEGYDVPKPHVPRDHVREVYLILADASQGTVDPSRAEDIARRAIAEAVDNREGK